jgi:hypothetical protein
MSSRFEIPTGATAKYRLNGFERVLFGVFVVFAFAQASDQMPSPRPL